MPQLELEFRRDNPNSDEVTALYAFGSGNTLPTFDCALILLGTTDSSTDLFTPTLSFAQPGFLATDPVPEPSSLAILVVGLFGLAAFRTSRKTPTRRPPRYPRRRRDVNSQASRLCVVRRYK
jgi:hypothetical protein